MVIIIVSEFICKDTTVERVQVIQEKKVKNCQGLAV